MTAKTWTILGTVIGAIALAWAVFAYFEVERVPTVANDSPNVTTGDGSAVVIGNNNQTNVGTSE